MGNCTRTFFAIEIPERLGQELERLQAELAAEVPDCRWAKTRPFHMTIAFLGDVQDRDLDRLHELVAASVRHIEPMDMRLVGLGAFPVPNRPKVLWVGASTSVPERLEDIRESVVKATARGGYRAQDERFNPHVTLGRFKPGRRGPCDLTAVMERYRARSYGEFIAEDVVGFASRAVGAATSYDVLSRGRLSGEKSRSST
jgi:2'-5' RNA ligase